MGYTNEHDIERREHLRNPAEDRLGVVSLATSALEALAQLFGEDPVVTNSPPTQERFETHRYRVVSDAPAPVYTPEASPVSVQTMTEPSAVHTDSEAYLAAQKAVDEAFLGMEQGGFSSN